MQLQACNLNEILITAKIHCCGRCPASKSASPVYLAEGENPSYSCPSYNSSCTEFGWSCSKVWKVESAESFPASFCVLTASGNSVAVTCTARLLWVYIAQKELWCCWLNSSPGIMTWIGQGSCTCKVGAPCQWASWHPAVRYRQLIRANVRIHQLIQRPEIRSIHNKLMRNCAQI